MVDKPTVKDWDWDREGYPIGVINSDRTVRLAWIGRESTATQSAYKLTYKGTNFHFLIQQAEHIRNAIVLRLDIQKLKEVVNSYNEFAGANHGEDDVITAFSQSLAALLEKKRFSSPLDEKYRTDDFHVKIEIVG